MDKLQRLVFGETLVALGESYPNMVVLDADVSSSTQTRLFAERYPERFFNFGIAEANMVSAAAGLATCGYIPFVSTFALFIALRAGDQVRAQIAYPGTNVKLVGGYAGLSDYADGASHQSVEDIAVMRAIPNMTVICPADVTETAMAVHAAAAHNGPVYLRMSREAVPTIFGPAHPFAIGQGITVRDGCDVTVITTGTVLPLALQAVEEMAGEGIAARVIDMHTVKPLDIPLVLRASRETGALVTVEEHNVLGGLGSAVCEAVGAEYPVPVARVGIRDRFGESGTYAEILERAGVSVAEVRAQIRRVVAMKSARPSVV